MTCLAVGLKTGQWSACGLGRLGLCSDQCWCGRSSEWNRCWRQPLNIESQSERFSHSQRSAGLCCLRPILHSRRYNSSCHWTDHPSTRSLWFSCTWLSIGCIFFFTVVISLYLVHHPDVDISRDLSHSRVRFEAWLEQCTELLSLSIRCCAAAWEQKMRDKLPDSLNRKGAAASAAVSDCSFDDVLLRFFVWQFWLFIAMIGIVVDYVLRLTSRPSQSFTP